MGALYDDWVENAPNGVSWDDYRSGNYYKDDKDIVIDNLRKKNEKLIRENDDLKNRIEQLQLELNSYKQPKYADAFISKVKRKNHKY